MNILEHSGLNCSILLYCLLTAQIGEGSISPLSLSTVSQWCHSELEKWIIHRFVWNERESTRPPYFRTTNSVGETMQFANYIGWSESQQKKLDLQGRILSIDNIMGSCGGWIKLLRTTAKFYSGGLISTGEQDFSKLQNSQLETITSHN